MLRPVLFLTVLAAVVHIQAPVTERWGEKQCREMKRRETMQGIQITEVEQNRQFH